MNIAIIDSGINPNHSHVQSVAGGVGISLDEKGGLQFSADYSDTLGHGTAIAGVIREKVPTANLYAIKIFHERLTASIQSLLTAIGWAVEHEMKIIHLSLGTTLCQYKKDLEDLCQQALRLGSIVVAAARGPDDHIYPASLETVIGAYWEPECQKDVLQYHAERRIDFGAYGCPRPLPGLPQRLNLQGHSFAAAHVTAHTAKLLESHPDLDLLEVKKQLAQNLMKENI
jgi:hypothetical protein